jgi:hypothetical protein
MGKWIVLLSVLIAGTGLWFILLRPGIEQGGDAPAVIATNPKALTIAHAFKDGVHRYDGILRLSHSCYDVESEVVHDPRNANTLTLILTTRDKMLEQNLCVKIPTRYPFEIITDAPKDTSTMLSVDGVNTPIVIIETEWMNPRGTVLNLEN